MKKVNKKTEFSVLEAVDNLASMADIDLEQGKKDRHILLEKLKNQSNWMSYESKKATDEKIKTTFSTIHKYLEHLNKNIPTEERKAHFQRGVIAIKNLTHDAINKIDSLNQILNPNNTSPSIETFDEVKDLNRFFLNFDKFYYDQELEEEEFDLPGSLYSSSAQDLIKEFNIIKSDENYELLFIKREDNLPFFSQEALNHARYICDFDISFLDFISENPLKMMKVIQDEEACTIASEIYEKIKNDLHEFLKSYKTHKEDVWSNLLYKSLLALLAAKNPENMLRSHRKKNCLEYFKDFYNYFSEFLSHPLMENIEKNDYYKKVKNVVQAMNGWFFLHPMNHPKAIEVIKDLIKSGQMQPMQRHSIWTWFKESYGKMEETLKKFPSGPVYNLINHYENGDFDNGFSSIGLGNTPSTILHFSDSHKERCLLYLPSPTIQNKISHAKLVEEFDIFLNLNTNKHLMLFNLQDKQFSSKARSLVIEQAELTHPNLHVISIPKDTNFYNQQKEFFDLENAGLFMKALYDQIQGSPISGFHFPKNIDIEKIKHFSQKIIPFIHEKFFDKNKQLLREKRLDFIEIFYGFLILEIIFSSKVDFVSFTCKDALDIGSMNTLQFFTMLKFFKNPKEPLGYEDHDRILQVALVPAFIQRCRMTSYSRLERMLSALTTFEEAYNFSENDFSKLFSFFTEKKIEDINWLD